MSTTMTEAVSIPAQHTNPTDTIETITGTVQEAQAAPVSVFYRVEFMHPAQIFTVCPRPYAVVVELDHVITTPAQYHALCIDLITTFALDEETKVTKVSQVGRHEVPWGDLVAVDDTQDRVQGPRGWRARAGAALRRLGVSR